MFSKYENVFTEQTMVKLASEFLRLEGQTYLDHAGATLYAESQIQNVSRDLVKNVYSNPHSSKHTSNCIDQVRFQVLNHFNTNSNEYSVIFTSGATEALKLVADSFEFMKNDQERTETSLGCFAYLQNSHTSVLGMREVAVCKKAKVICVPHDDMLETMMSAPEHNAAEILNPFNSLEQALFVFPAQCNFSGYKYPLKWIAKIHHGVLNEFTQKQCGKTFPEWAVLLDAAAFVSTNRLDLSAYKPDFVCLSFYKIFGYPTGLGALLVRNRSAHLLNGRKFYGGGTVQISLSGDNYHIRRNVVHEKFEDGTVSFLSIMALKHGFNTMHSIISPGLNEKTMDLISEHTFKLAKTFFEKLNTIKHFNGSPIACIYAETVYADIHQQGGIVNFNLLRSNGDYIGYSEVTHMAELFNIQIRSGCFCNPGACQRFLNLSRKDLLSHFLAGHICGDNNDLINGVPTGSLRVSFGYMSTIHDIESIVNMIIKCFVDSDPKISLANELAKLKLMDHRSVNTDNTVNSDFAMTTPGEDKTLKARGILRQIHIYPLKSCSAFKISSYWEMGAKGLKYDRDWMIVTEDGVALTQKMDTRMCIIQPSIDLGKNILCLSFPGVDDVTISLTQPNGQLTAQNSLCRSKVCGDNIEGYDCGDEAANWLLNVLGIPGLRLIRQSDAEIRLYKKGILLTVEQSPLSLSNKAQYHAINLASIKWLADKIENQEVEDNLDNLVDRFRGNFIIDAENAFEEFSWQLMKIGSTDFQMIGPCTRCQMVCIDQATGEKTIEPLRTISKHFEGKVNFGAYFSHLLDKNERKIISCGDVVFAKLIN